MSALFAATYPARTSALVMYGTYAKWIRDAEYPWAPTREDHEAAFAAYEKGWNIEIDVRHVFPTYQSGGARRALRKRSVSIRSASTKPE